MRIDSFLATLDTAAGLARPNLFQVGIWTAPLATKAQDGAAGWLTDYAEIDVYGAPYRLAMTCSAADLPSYQFGTNIHRQYGPAFQYPHTPQYQDVTMSFFVGNDFYEKYFFDAWMYMICEPSTFDFNYIQEYCTNIDIVQLDHQDNIIYDVTLIDAYPVSQAAMRLDWSNNNQIHKLDVTFTFKRAEPFYGYDTSNDVRAVRGANQRTFRSTIDRRTANNAPAQGSANQQ